jgi:hypothetical protein
MNVRKPALDLSDIVRQPCTVISRSIVVRALAARSPELLGRAERSSPTPLLRRAVGAGLDGESAARATIMPPTMRVVIGHCPRDRVPDSTYDDRMGLRRVETLAVGQLPPTKYDRPYRGEVQYVWDFPYTLARNDHLWGYTVPPRRRGGKCLVHLSPIGSVVNNEVMTRKYCSA